MAIDKFGPRHASRGQLIDEIAALKAENERLRNLLQRTDTALIEANGRQEQGQG